MKQERNLLASDKSAVSPVYSSLQHDLGDEEVEIIRIVDESQSYHVQCFFQLVLGRENQGQQVRHIHQIYYTGGGFNFVGEPGEIRNRTEFFSWLEKDLTAQH